MMIAMRKVRMMTMRMIYTGTADAGNWPFYDYCHPPAPWAQNSKQKRREFWAARDDWEQMMKQPYMIDYVRVYQ